MTTSIASLKDLLNVNTTDLYNAGGIEQVGHASKSGWHDVGKDIRGVKSTADLIDTLGLGWEVEKRPLRMIVGDEGGETMNVPGKFALMRKTDNRIFDVVGAQWAPVQNAEVLETFDEFVKAGDLEFHAAGSTLNGAHVWAVAKIKKEVSLLGDDRSNGYVCLSNPHMGGHSVSLRFFAERLYCANQIQLAFGAEETSRSVLSFRHVGRQRFDADVAKKIIAGTDGALEAYKAKCEAMTKIKPTPMQIDRYLRHVWGIKEPRGATPEDNIRRERNQAIVDSLKVIAKTQPGVESGEGTMYQWLNAATYAVDHATGRGSPEKRFQSAMFGAGNVRKARAYRLALHMA